MLSCSQVRQRDEMAAVRRLAVSVFVQALRDAQSGNGERLAARNFLLRDNPDFSFWCSLAGIEPERAKEAIRRQLSKPPRKKWRTLILAELRKNPNMSNSEIARKLKCPRNIVWHHRQRAAG